MNVRVTVDLQGREEYALFQTFVEALVDLRAVPEGPPAVVETKSVFDGTELATLAAAPNPPPITDAELEAAITAYWKKMGLPAAKAVLAKYEVERVGAIPANRRGEAMLDLSGVLHGA